MPPLLIQHSTEKTGTAEELTQQSDDKTQTFDIVQPPSVKNRATSYILQSDQDYPAMAQPPSERENPSLVYRQRIYSQQEFLSLCMSFAKDSWSEFAA